MVKLTPSEINELEGYLSMIRHLNEDPDGQQWIGPWEKKLSEAIIKYDVVNADLPDKNKHEELFDYMTQLKNVREANLRREREEEQEKANPLYRYNTLLKQLQDKKTLLAQHFTSIENYQSLIRSHQKSIHETEEKIKMEREHIRLRQDEITATENLIDIEKQRYPNLIPQAQFLDQQILDCKRRLSTMRESITSYISNTNHCTSHRT
jgi:chromosome segregation ATPase